MPTIGPSPRGRTRRSERHGKNVKDVKKLNGGLANAMESITEIREHLRWVELVLLLTLVAASASFVFLVITQIQMTVHMKEYDVHTHPPDPGSILAPHSHVEPPPGSLEELLRDLQFGGDDHGHDGSGDEDLRESRDVPDVSSPVI
jgi:hypothetical protein